MKRVILVFALFLFLSGCVSPEVKIAETPADKSDMLSRGAEMIEAFQKQDYPLFARQFGGNVPDNFGEKEFDSGVKQMESRVGKVTSSRFLGTLSGPVFTTWLWAVNFSKFDKDGKEVSQEMVFKVVAGKLDGKMQIVSFGFLL